MAITRTELGPPEAVSGRDYRLLIGGELVAPADGRFGPVTDPSTGEVLTEAPQGSAADIQAATEAAQRAQPEWEAMGLAGRSACFARLGELMVENLETLALVDSVDSGNPLQAMRDDVRISLPYIDGWPRLAGALAGDVIPASAGNLHYTRHRPYGVVGRITAFNHPLMFAATRPLPALITGNTVVMKPSPLTPLSTLVFGELVAEAFPPGVLNIVTGGADVGQALVSHRDIKRLAFTGSVSTGLAIQAAAAQSGRVKELSLELGGKNAMVVLPDVDIDEAVEGAIYGMNLTVCQGQSCGSNSRVLVHESIHDAFVSRMAERLRALKVGPAHHDHTDVGPLVSHEHRQRVEGFVERAVADGAELVSGGERPDGVPAGGFYLQPTLFAGVLADMEVGREEIFGPVISVMAWSDLDKALEIANGLDLGLTASVWTRDLDLALSVAERLDAGYVWVNDSSRHYFGTPFGGTHDSGSGREESLEELYSYLETKAVHVRLRDSTSAFERLIGQKGESK